MDALRILLTTESSGWSGGAAQTVLLAQELIKRGHSIWIGCRSSSDVYKRAQQLQIPLFPIRIRGDADLIAVARLVRFIVSNKINVLHAQHPKAHATGLLAALLTPRRLAFFVTRRVSFPMKDNPFSHWKYTSSRIDALIAVSEGIKDVLVQEGVDLHKIRVIYSAVDPTSFRPSAMPQLVALRKMLGIKADVPVLIKIANYSDWKGQAVFLEAAAILLANGCKVHFILAGRGNDGPEIAQQLNRLGIKNDVIAMGFRTDVPNLLSLADASINSAVEGEGLSGALRESLFLGVPVIAADVSGNRELVEDGITGRLVPPKNPKALARAMRWVIENKSEAKLLAEQGRTKVRAQMLIENTTTQIESLYRQFLP